MRKKMVAGNWKMNGSRYEARTLLESIKQGASGLSAVDITVFPSFVHLQEAEEILADSRIAWGAQNLYLGKSGAFTGEVSGTMLVDYGCQYVLIGHSERRQLFREDVNWVAAKFKAAQQSGLQPVLCVGETQEERDQGQTENILRQQLASVVEAASIDAFRHAVLAYEPVWAIGTGLTATPDEAEAGHAFIRNVLAEYSADVAGGVRILYGGSVKADNAKGLFAMPNIDGGLVGGASLDAKAFLSICEAAM
ncbi:MAG TPA: triose-phosphate isomerase [Gammaproteobacteria bacterium]|nr:triose-phosphate isomerase [Gammaproteobacteria bacterium]